MDEITRIKHQILKGYCQNCKKYVDWTESAKKNPVCPIENSMWEQDGSFPSELIGFNGKYFCSQFERK